jgi:hypothetical protein
LLLCFILCSLQLTGEGRITEWCRTGERGRKGKRDFLFFFANDFFAVDFFAVDFFAVDFFAVDFLQLTFAKVNCAKFVILFP